MRRQSLQRVKTPARAILEAAAAVFFVIIHDGPSDGREYTLPNTAMKTVFQIKRSISWEFCPHPYPYFCEKSGLPETYPPPLFNQTVGFVDTFRWAKRAGMGAANRANLSAKQQPPFTEHLLPSGTQVGLRAGSPEAHRFWRCSARQCTCFHEGTG